MSSNTECQLCGENVIPSFRQEGNHRKFWFCCQLHGVKYSEGKRMCLCCGIAYRHYTQLVCNWCHVNVYGGRLH